MFSICSIYSNGVYILVLLSVLLHINRGSVTADLRNYLFLEFIRLCLVDIVQTLHVDDTRRIDRPHAHQIDVVR